MSAVPARPVAPRDGLSRAASAIDRLAVLSGRFVGWMLVPMILSLAYEVVARYGFGSPTAWAYDMTFMLFGAFFMLGAAYTLQRDGHIRTDMFYGEWSARRQGAADLAGYVLFFLPLVLVFTVTGWEYFAKAWTTNERFVSSPWMPVTWPFRLVMPLTGALLLVQGVAEMLRCVAAIRHNAWPEREREA